MEGRSPAPRAVELGRWVAARHVSSTLTPRVEVHEHARVQDGLELTLAVPVAAGLAAGPGEPECYRDWTRLRQVVAHALPSEQGWDCRIDPFDHSFHLRRETSWTPEIELTAAVDGPLVSPAVGRSAAARLASALKGLGVRTSP